MEADAQPGPWLSGRDLQAEGGVRLFCLPHAGSGAAAFYRWKRLLPAGVHVCPVLLPGRELRLSEACATDAVALAGELTHAIRGLCDRPYAIFGHSMGSLIAYEWCRQMAAAGLRGPEWLIVSGRNAPSSDGPRRALHTLPDARFVEELTLRYRGMPEDFLADPELREVFLPILRADLTLVETYRPAEGVALGCPIAASAGVEDDSVTDEGLRAWAQRTSGRSRVERYVGDHFYHLGTGQAALLKTIASLLAPFTT